MGRKMFATNPSLVKHVISVRFFFLLCGISFLLSVVWIQSEGAEDNIVQEVIQNVGDDLKYINLYRKPTRLPEDFKYLLLWTPYTYSPFYFLGTGQKAFIQNNCSVINCYVTTNRYLFGKNLTRFDAVAFNGRNIINLRPSELPQQRSIRQKYIFVNLESADNYPICSDKYEGYFNWTATYRLDSDIPYPYLLIKNKKGEIVGPKRDMKWRVYDSEIDNDLPQNFRSKSKAVAWFVSNCADRSGRRDFVGFLSSALSSYKLSVDIYGKCGDHKCPINQKTECDKMLERDYYFYLAMENSFANDYITEKVLTALQHNLVPIVYGAANYSSFLPPGSYIDAHGQDIDTLAATIASAIRSPELYSKFFEWKRYYTYEDPTASNNVCSICAALHSRNMVETTTVYTNFRRWWHPNYKDRCWWLDEDDEIAFGL